MPRKIKDKEINDMRRIIEIMMQHPKSAHKRMWEFCVGSVASRSKNHLPLNNQIKGCVDENN